MESSKQTTTGGGYAAKILDVCSGRNGFDVGRPGGGTGIRGQSEGTLKEGGESTGRSNQFTVLEQHEFWFGTV